MSDFVMRLESLKNALEEGRPVSYGDIGESDGRKFLTIWNHDGTYSQLCPDVLYELVAYIESLPSEEPPE